MMSTFLLSFSLSDRRPLPRLVCFLCLFLWPPSFSFRCFGPLITVYVVVWLSLVPQLVPFSGAFTLLWVILCCFTLFYRRSFLLSIVFTMVFFLEFFWPLSRPPGIMIFPNLAVWILLTRAISSSSLLLLLRVF